MSLSLSYSLCLCLTGLSLSLSSSLSGFKVLRKGSHREGLGTLVALETGTPKNVGFAALPFDSSCSIGTWDGLYIYIYIIYLLWP